MPPSPPSQLDWVILQRFAKTEVALAWLRADEKQRLVAQVQPMLVGQDDVHLLEDNKAGVLPAPASAVISTRIKPGQEDVYREWERRIAAAQARAPGFQRLQFEPPVPGVQNDWLAILRLNSEETCKLGSLRRRQETARGSGCVHRRIPGADRSRGVRPVVRAGQQRSTSAGCMEAEYDRADGALPRGLSLQ